MQGLMDIPENGEDEVKTSLIVSNVKKIFETPRQEVIDSFDDTDEFKYRLGDIEQQEVGHDLWWFAQEPGKKTKRRVFVSIKVKRISSVDIIEQSFRLWFHIYFNWMMTYEEWKSFEELDDKSKYEPGWYPQIESRNLVEPHLREWEEYPDGSKFRIYPFKQYEWPRHHLTPQAADFDPSKSKFIRAKLSCDITFSEQMEIENFPFDCQDLCVYSQERTKKALFLPELRKHSDKDKHKMSFFGHIDPTFSDITEWKLVNAYIKFEEKSQKSKSTYPQIILKLKVQRKWHIQCVRMGVILLMLAGLLLTQFSIDPVDDQADRLGLGVTFLLTYVAYIQIVVDILPNVPYVTFMEYYIAYGFLFCTLIMIEAALAGNHEWVEDNDTTLFWVFFIVFILYHIGFVYKAHIKYKHETKKLWRYDTEELINKANLDEPLYFHPNSETVKPEIVKNKKKDEEKCLNLLFEASKESDDT